MIDRLKLYLDLIRWNRPAGWLLLLWPTLSALWVAADGFPGWHLVVVFTLGTILMRSAGCCINDVADRDFDRHVKRTAGRPVTTGAVSVNTSGFTAGYLPLYTIVTGASSVTSYTDQRTLALATNATLAKALSDANATLTQPEAANATLTFTGTLTATRDIVVPLVGKKQWTVYNGTGQSLRFIGASGTGITVATLKHAVVRSDGTNIVRVMADT